MREIVKSMLILTVIYLLLFFLVNTNRKSQVTTEKQLQPVIVTDTLTNVVYDTVYLERYKTVKLRTTDTTICYITDTVKRVDSVFVEVPISVYKFDSTFTTDTTQLNLSIRNSGYDVKLDSLFYKFEYTPRPPKKTNFFKEHFKFGAGVSTGYGCFSKQPDVFVGVGFYYCF